MAQGSACSRSARIGRWIPREPTAPPFFRRFHSPERRVTFQRFRQKPLRKYLIHGLCEVLRQWAAHGRSLHRSARTFGRQAREASALDLRLRGEDFFARARALLAKRRGRRTPTLSSTRALRAGRSRLGCRNAGRMSSASLHAELRSREHPDGFARPRASGSAFQKSNRLFGATTSTFRGETDLPGLAAVIKGARLLCGVDTAAMHLADAMKTPSLVLFGPTNPSRWRPRHARSEVLRARTRPPFTPQQKGGPMEQISVASVVEGVKRLLALSSVKRA